ncbi:hypothetical protein EIK77_008358 [Talaromyces pinophilus]|nr:hypothetical protein EIK77_008358 [Talaromyces pinophilus]
MYYMFFDGKTNNSYWRPFKDVQMDGVDLDQILKPVILVEATLEDGQTYQLYYDEFVTRLRELQGVHQLIVSAAPKCHHGCPSNCNALEQTVNQTPFDYLFSESVISRLAFVSLPIPRPYLNSDGCAVLTTAYLEGSTLNPGPHDLRILETSTTFYPESAANWLMAHYLTNLLPDLVCIKTSNTGSGKVEVHVASGTSSYQNCTLETGTIFTLENNDVWQMIDYDGDGKPDLIYIKTSNTRSGKVEVHVAAG